MEDNIHGTKVRNSACTLEACGFSLQRTTLASCIATRSPPFCPVRRCFNRLSELLTGKELRDDIAQMQNDVDGDMRALRGEHAAADRALTMQLRAVLEQARDMRVWREQHNVRVLEMQA